MEIKEPCKNQIADLRKLWKEAFGDTDEFLDDFFVTAYAKERCRCVTVDGEIAAALYWFGCDVKEEMADNTMADLQAATLSENAMPDISKYRIAYIYAVATAKKFQGQGICHKLMEETHKHLRECGYEGAILVPGNEGLFHFYEGIGYQNCSKIREFRCVGEPQNILFEQIDKSKYEELRRRFLPEGGVIQEGVNLDFLETQAKFYTGEDFLLTACRDGEILRGVELLGNTKVAGRMVHALGYKEGYFRVPVKEILSVADDSQGETMDFGMFYPLAEKIYMPGYFGLAFD